MYDYWGKYRDAVRRPNDTWPDGFAGTFGSGGFHSSPGYPSHQYSSFFRGRGILDSLSSVLSQSGNSFNKFYSRLPNDMRSVYGIKKRMDSSEDNNPLSNVLQDFLNTHGKRYGYRATKELDEVDREMGNNKMWRQATAGYRKGLLGET